MIIQGHVHRGVVVLDEPVLLPEGTEVSVQPLRSIPDSFWHTATLDELACQQGVDRVHGDEDLLGGWPEDEVDDGFEQVVVRWRQGELEQP